MTCLQKKSLHLLSKSFLLEKVDENIYTQSKMQLSYKESAYLASTQRILRRTRQLGGT